MKFADLARYGLWGCIAATANANRRYYRMTTTWLPHFLANSVTLLLPDLGRRLPRVQRQEHNLPSKLGEIARLAQETVSQMVCENPRYVMYVMPLALGYITSHPQFNIYKGDLADKRVFGFGLDAIPHTATGLALTLLVCDTTRVAAATPQRDAQIAAMLHWCDAHHALVSGAVVVLATALWESGEYTIHRHELVQRGDVAAINMQWSVEDTVFDCLSNTIGWLTGVLYDRSHTATHR